MYPAFVNCTTIDWFSEWPQDALLEVAEKYLESMELGDDEVRNNVPALKRNSFTCKIQSLDVDREHFVCEILKAIAILQKLTVQWLQF